MIGIITTSGPEKTVVTFRDGETWTWHPTERIRSLYHIGLTVEVEFAPDRSAIVSSFTAGTRELVRQGVAS